MYRGEALKLETKVTAKQTAKVLGRQTAKVFMTGRSQAVRLPAEFRFDGKEVYVRRDDKNGDVILSRKPVDWDELFAKLDAAGVPDDFLTPEDRNQGPSQEREYL
jgi:antitoxin VapB